MAGTRRLLAVATFGTWIFAVSAHVAHAGKPPPTPPPFDRTRIELERADGQQGPITVEKDQVAVTVTVVGPSNYEDPSLGIPSVPYDYVHKVGPQRMLGNLTLCQMPFFHVVVKNNAEQVLKINGFEEGGPDEVIVALEDDKQNVLEATRKEDMKGYWDVVFRTMAASSTTPGLYETLSTAGNGAIVGIPVLTGRANILPGRTKTFWACFTYLPPTSTAKDIPAWFADKSAFTLGLFDLPVARDEGGGVLKKSTFQFEYAVAEYTDHYVWKPNPDQAGGNINVLDHSTRVRGPAPGAASAPAPAPAPAPAATDPETAPPPAPSLPAFQEGAKFGANSPEWAALRDLVLTYCKGSPTPDDDCSLRATQAWSKPLTSGPCTGGLSMYAYGAGSVGVAVLSTGGCNHAGYVANLRPTPEGGGRVSNAMHDAPAD